MVQLFNRLDNHNPMQLQKGGKFFGFVQKCNSSVRWASLTISNVSITITDGCNDKLFDLKYALNKPYNTFT